MNENKLTSAQIRAGHRRRIKEISERSTPRLQPLVPFSQVAQAAKALQTLRASQGVLQMGP